jgi:hypothetical protein
VRRLVTRRPLTKRPLTKKLLIERPEIRQSGKDATLTQSDPRSSCFEIQRRQDRPRPRGSERHAFRRPIEKLVSVRGDDQRSTRYATVKNDQRTHRSSADPHRSPRLSMRLIGIRLKTRPEAGGEGDLTIQKYPAPGDHSPNLRTQETSVD